MEKAAKRIRKSNFSKNEVRTLLEEVDPNFRIKGIVSAPVTPFTKDGELNLSLMPSYVKWLDTHDIDAAFILGTLGEGMSLSVAERKVVAENWVQAVKTTEKLKTVIVHVGTGNIKESAELAEHAEKIGAAAIACMAPNYNKPQNEEILVECMKSVADAAPKTPFYYYDINFMTVKTARFLELAVDKIPNLRGAKISSRDLPDIADCTLVADGHYQIMIGTDEQFITALSLGVEVPVLNSFLGGIFKRLKTAFDNKDLDIARKEQIHARKLVQLRERYGGMAPMVKSILRWIGLDLGSARLPNKDLSDDQEKELHKDLDALGFLDK